MQIRTRGRANSRRDVLGPRALRASPRRDGADRGVHRHQREQGDRRRARVHWGGDERAVVEIATHDHRQESIPVLGNKERQRLGGGWGLGMVGMK